MSDINAHHHRQFFPAPTNDPAAPVRDKAGNIVGGSVLQEFEAEVEDLARLLFATSRPLTADAAVASMPKHYEAALKVVLARREFTQEFTDAERARIAQDAELAARSAAHREAGQKRIEAARERERIDRQTRDQVASWKPRASTRPNTPEHAIERAEFIVEINRLRAQHDLNPLPV